MKLNSLSYIFVLGFTYLILVTIFYTAAIAEGRLFESLPALRTAENLPEWLDSRDHVLLNPDEVDTADFELSLPSWDQGSRVNLSALSTHVSTRANTRSLIGRSFESTRGFLLDEEGNPLGNYVLTEARDNSSGNKEIHGLFRLATTGEHFSLRKNSDGIYTLEAQNHDHMSPCGHDDHQEFHEETSSEVNSLRSLPTLRSTAPVIDVLVMYTPEAKDYAGGTEAVEALVAQAIEITNESYENSGLSITLRLAHTQETTESESSSFATDLSRLAGTSDGYFDDAHTLRETHYADMVALLRSPGEYCGIGYSASTKSGLQSGDLAFSVTAANCVTYYSFGHELGHNLGLQHDADNAPSSTAYDDPYGHRWDGSDSNQYRSVMAYSPGTRVSHFSNPDVDYLGAATGVANSADNANVLEIMGPYAEDFRVNPNGNGSSEGGSGGGSSGGGSSGGSGSGGEGGSESGNSLVTSKQSVKKNKRNSRVTLAVTATDIDGAAIAGATVYFYQYRKNKAHKLLETGITDENGQYVATTRVRIRKGKRRRFYTTATIDDDVVTSEIIRVRAR